MATKKIIPDILLMWMWTHPFWLIPSTWTLRYHSWFQRLSFHPSKKLAPNRSPRSKEKKPKKGKVPKKKFSKDNPAAYVTAAVWKSMSKEEQQAARASRHEQGIPTRSNNSPHLQFPSFDFETPEVDNDPHQLEATVGTTSKEDPITYPLELQKMQIMELTGRHRGFRSIDWGLPRQFSHGALFSYSSSLKRPTVW
jgi:hypothetical protein